MDAPYASARNRPVIGRVPFDVTEIDARGHRLTGDPERVTRRDHLIGAVATTVVLVVWSLLAAWRPTSTYHLAPVVAAAAWPVALRRGGPLRVAPVDALRGAAAAATMTIIVSVLLWQLDLLRGPTLWDSGDALVETIPAALVGAVGGHRYARCGPSG